MRPRTPSPTFLEDSLPLIRADGHMMTLAEIEAAVIDYALVMCGSYSQAANALGIGRTTLYRRMRELRGTTPAAEPQSHGGPAHLGARLEGIAP